MGPLYVLHGNDQCRSMAHGVLKIKSEIDVYPSRLESSRIMIKSASLGTSSSAECNAETPKCFWLRTTHKLAQTSQLQMLIFPTR